MKKLTAILLCLGVLLSVSACRSAEASSSAASSAPAPSSSAVSVSSAVPASSEAPASSAVSVSSSSEAPVSSEAPAGPAFDTSWASNDFEALLPELPFTGWTTSQESDKTYAMELGGLKTETLTDADGKTIGYGEDKTALIEYLDSLADYGFSVEETGGIEGYVYEWMVIDEAGNEIEFTCAEGYCWIEILKKA